MTERSQDELERMSGLGKFQLAICRIFAISPQELGVTVVVEGTVTRPIEDEARLLAETNVCEETEDTHKPPG